jgi:hypothetical protein
VVGEDLAVSMKLMPASKAASTHAFACSLATPPEYVSHEPRLISETSMSLEPSLRRFIGDQVTLNTMSCVGCTLR